MRFSAGFTVKPPHCSCCSDKLGRFDESVQSYIINVMLCLEQDPKWTEIPMNFFGKRVIAEQVLVL